MNAELFTFMLVFGIIIACVGAWFIAHSVFSEAYSDGTERWIVRGVGVLLLAAWIWLPWMIYGLTCLPWSALGRVLPPKSPSESRGVQFNPSGAPAMPAKSTKSMEIER